MEVVIDSNVFFRILISQGDIIELLFNDNLQIFAPMKLKEEFIKNKKEILEKSSLLESDFEELSSEIFNRITFVPLGAYESFVPRAKQFLGEHEKDIAFVALCLSKKLSLWTYESLLFEIGLGISTKQISNELSSLSSKADENFEE
jgi:predicted nucleic acid-binding protein